jgi:O-antigen ligase
LFLVATCLVGYFIITYFPEYFSLFNRKDTYNESFEVRYKIWQEAFNIFSQQPVVGVGMGSYLDYVRLHSVDGYYVIDNEIVDYGTESGYLRVLCETGVLGFILIFSFVIIPLVSALKSIRKRARSLNVCLLISGIVCWLTAFVTLYSLSDKRIFILLATLICLLGMSTRDSRVNNHHLLSYEPYKSI